MQTFTFSTHFPCLCHKLNRIIKHRVVYVSAITSELSLKMFKAMLLFHPRIEAIYWVSVACWLSVYLSLNDRSLYHQQENSCFGHTVITQTVSILPLSLFLSPFLTLHTHKPLMQHKEAKNRSNSFRTLTNLPLDKMATIFLTIFHMHFREWKNCILLTNLLRFVPKGLIDYDSFFGLHPDKRLSKQSWDWWLETPSHSLWRHCYVHDTTVSWI